MNEAVKKHSQGNLLKLKERVETSIVVAVNTHTVEFLDDDGYSCSIQIPFIDSSGNLTQAGIKALKEVE